MQTSQVELKLELHKVDKTKLDSNSTRIKKMELFNLGLEVGTLGYFCYCILIFNDLNF